MKLFRQDHRLRAAVFNSIEMLESRCLLSATLGIPIPPQKVPEATPGSIALGTYFYDPSITGTAVDIQTSLGDIPLVFTDSTTPATIADFVAYVNNNAYSNTIIHNSASGVIQGGSYTSDGNQIAQVAAQGPTHETGSANTVGTIAMISGSGTSNPTSQWYINVGDNSATRANSSSTVFGNVLYNGMSVVDAIASLPTVNDNAQVQNATLKATKPWSNLPVVNYPGSNPALSVPSADMVTTNPQIIPSGLIFSAVSSDSSVLRTSISNGTLYLTPVNGATGTSHVTVTATDLGGGKVSRTFLATVVNDSIVGANFPVIQLSAHNTHSVTYDDVSGVTGTLSIRGPGTATVDLSGTGVTQVVVKGTARMIGSGVSILRITTSGTNSKTVLSFTTDGASQAVGIGTITTQSLKAFIGKHALLTGDLVATGRIGTLLVGGASGGTVDAAAIGDVTSIGAFSDNLSHGTAGVALGNFEADSISGGFWTINGSVNSITAGSASNWAPKISGAIKTLAVINGDLSTILMAGSIRVLRVKGGISNSAITLTASGENLKTLSVTGAITSASFNATGSIGDVLAASLTDSQIYAGIGNLDGALLPTSATNFVSQQTISSVKLQNVGTSFSNSDIAAATLSDLSLGNIVIGNAGITDGIAAERVTKLNALVNGKKLPLLNLTKTSNIPSILSGLAISLGDFAIKLY